jgi:hypothetical protein
VNGGSPGANHFDQSAKGKHVLRLVNRLQNLGLVKGFATLGEQVWFLDNLEALDKRLEQSQAETSL